MEHSKLLFTHLNDENGVFFLSCHSSINKSLKKNLKKKAFRVIYMSVKRRVLDSSTFYYYTAGGCQNINVNIETCLNRSGFIVSCELK